MKTVVALAIVLISSLSFADTTYVRRSIVNDGVTAQQGEGVRDVLRKAAQDAGFRVSSTPGQASTSIRATISKTGNTYSVKVEKVKGGKIVQSSQVQNENVNEAAKLASSTVLASNSSGLPAKVGGTESVEAVTTPSGTDENRAVAASPEQSVSAAAEVKKSNFIKNWFVALGPDLANSQSGTNGTKVAAMVAYSLGLAEHFNLMFFYDTNLNTSTIGSSAVSIFGVGAQYFLNDRVADFSPFVRLDTGFGGGNRTQDSTESFGAGIGVDLFRTQPATFEVMLREFALNAAGNWPTITQLMFGIYF